MGIPGAESCSALLYAGIMQTVQKNDVFAGVLLLIFKAFYDKKIDTYISTMWQGYPAQI